MRRLALSLLVLAVLAPAPARPVGGHSKIGCTACHGLKAAEGTSSFCLQCHSTKDQGGRDILPVDKHVSHPFGLASVRPKVAKVPAELLRADGRFDCLSCHDPHPSNANYAYLRVSTGPKGGDMEGFCAVCHPSKSGQVPAALGGKPRR